MRKIYYCGIFILVGLLVLPPMIYGRDWSRVSQVLHMIEEGEYDAASSALLADSASWHSDDKMRAVWHTLKGMTQVAARDDSDAVRHLDVAIAYFDGNETFENSAEDSIRLKCYATWANAHAGVDDERAAMTIERAIAHYDARDWIDEEYLALLMGLIVRSDLSDLTVRNNIKQRLFSLSEDSRLTDSKLLGHLYLCQATLAHGQGDSNTALELLEKGIAAFRQSPEYSQETGYHNLIGFYSLALLYSGNHEKALEYCREYFTLMSNSKKYVPISIAEDFSAFAENWISNGLIETGENMLQAALAIYQSEGKQDKAEALREKLAALHRATHLTEESSIDELLLSAQADMQNDDWENAIAKYDRVMQIMEGRIGDYDSDSLSIYGEVCSIVARGHLLADKLHDAEALFMRGLDVLQRCKNNESACANLLVSLGQYYNQISDWERALEALSEAKYLYERNLDFTDNYYICLAAIASQLLPFDYGQSWILSNAAARYFSQQPTSVPAMREYASCLITQIWISANMGMRQKSAELVAEVERLIEGNKDVHQAFGSDAYTAMAFAAMTSAQKVTPDVVEYLKKADALTPRGSSFDISMSEYVLGNDKACRVSSRKCADQIKEDVISKFTFLPAGGRDIYWNARHGDLLTCDALLLYSGGDAECRGAIYDDLLFSKGLLLRSADMISQEIERSGDKEAIGTYQRVLQLYRQLEDDKIYSDSARAIRQEIRAIESDLAKRFSSVSKYRQSLAKSWRDVRKSLADGEVAIEFVLLPDIKRDPSVTNLFDSIKTFHYYALVLDKKMKSPTVIKLCSETKFIDLVDDSSPEGLSERVRKRYADAQSENATGRMLYESVWKPIDSLLTKINAKTIYYSPYAGFNTLAFAAISDGEHFLAEKYELHQISTTGDIDTYKEHRNNQVSSATIYGDILYTADKEELLSEARAYQKQTTEPLLAFDPSLTRGGGKWAQLSNTRQEAISIEETLRQANVATNFLDSVRANEESFKYLSGHAPGLIHVATHGFYIPAKESEIQKYYFLHQNRNDRKTQTFNNPMLRSGLIFAGGNAAWTGKNIAPGIEDGIVTADEISQLDLQGVELITLSACETGLGDEKSSEGIFGLQRALKMAGCRTLIVSLWEVDDEVTYEFMTKFYSYWMVGNSKDVAFARAQREIREKESNPYLWAAFVMLH